MSRRTVVATLVGATLLGGLATPALADPVVGGQPTTVCLRLEPQSGAREGVCVWVPVRP